VAAEASWSVEAQLTKMTRRMTKRTQWCQPVVSRLDAVSSDLIWGHVARTNQTTTRQIQIQIQRLS
jgi:hypothetical protein